MLKLAASLLNFTDERAPSFDRCRLDGCILLTGEQTEDILQHFSGRKKKRELVDFSMSQSPPSRHGQKKKPSRRSLTMNTVSPFYGLKIGRFRT